ncbi:MAG: hypothetical protein ACOVQ4_16065, partial [Flectobacillus sp.]|uniref:hypothetical protein n=1 Tax=Flectobacillus sp. TaxID=50419 RepID=UPI003B9C3D51
ALGFGLWALGFGLWALGLRKFDFFDFLLKFSLFSKNYCGFEISDFGNIKTFILYRNILESLFYFRNQKSEIRHHYYTASDNDENVNSRIFIGGTI